MKIGFFPPQGDQKNLEISRGPASAGYCLCSAVHKNDSNHHIAHFEHVWSLFVIKNFCLKLWVGVLHTTIVLLIQQSKISGSDLGITFITHATEYIILKVKMLRY